MSRIHSGHGGSSGSTPPVRDEEPDWVDLDPSEVEEEVVALADQGLTQAEIGQALRDRLGVPNVQEVTDRSVGEILAVHGEAEEIPEDLMKLMERAVRVDEHLQENPKDISNRRGMELVESKIRRLVDYYQDEGVLDDDWTYTLEQAKLLTE